MSDTGNELSVTRFIAASPARVWEVMTTRLEEWFCPKPWTTEVVEMDLRPGGRSALIMRGPDGEGGDVQEGVYLDVVPERLMVFTDAFKPGWIPSGPFMVGFFRLEPEGDGTRYTAGARHWTEEARKQHEEMGFTQGWGAVADQLAALAEET